MPIIAWVILLLVLVLAPILLIRFRKSWVAAFNLAVTNRITSRFAARLPGFGILTHVGRKSGRVYRTPVKRFSRAGGIPDSAHLRTRKRMGQERNSRSRMQA
jgi:hypothetical protein